MYQRGQRSVLPLCGYCKAEIEINQKFEIIIQTETGLPYWSGGDPVFLTFPRKYSKVKNVNLFRKKERKWYQKRSEKHWKEAL